LHPRWLRPVRYAEFLSEHCASEFTRRMSDILLSFAA
jgi:hypothetical protein